MIVIYCFVAVSCFSSVDFHPTDPTSASPAVLSHQLLNLILLCAHLCTKLHNLPASRAQVCTNVCTNLSIMQECLCTRVHHCAQLGTTVIKCAQLGSRSVHNNAQVCTSTNAYMCMCIYVSTRLDVISILVKYYFVAVVLLLLCRFHPCGSEINESCGAISSVTEQHPTMCTLVYTRLPHLTKCLCTSVHT